MGFVHSSQVLIVVVLTLILLPFASGYVGSGIDFFEKYISVAHKHSNYVNENISEFRPVRFRIEPRNIAPFNVSTTTLTFDVRVDDDTPSIFPIFIAISQKTERIHLQLPFSYESKGRKAPYRYTKASRTICLKDNPHALEDIFVSFTTGSSQAIGIHMKVIVDDIRIRLGEAKSKWITPMSPAVFQMKFAPSMSQNLVVKVSSNNEKCMAIHIKEPKCPIFVEEDNLMTQTDWTLVTKTAHIRLDMREYLIGFLVKVVLLQDDALCGIINSPYQGLRKKNVTILVENDLPMSLSNGYFWLQISIPPILSLLVGVVIGSLYLVTYSCSRRRMMACRTYNVNKTEGKSVSVQQFERIRPKRSNHYGKWTIVIFSLHALPILEQAAYNGLVSKGATGIYGLCSYDTMCSHTFSVFKDFNHIWSNICYLILGLCFLLISFVKKVLQKRTEEGEGVPFSVGLYYAMGLGLVAKGVMSFAYHFCPSKANFQYETIYLTFLFGICHLKLIELRKPNTLNMGFCCGALASTFFILTLGVNVERYFNSSVAEDLFFGFRIMMAIIQGFVTFYAAVYAIYIGFPIDRYANSRNTDEVPLREMTVLNPHHNGRNRQNQSETEKIFMKKLSNIPRFLVIFPKLWHWRLPKFRCERIFYILLLLGLNGYLMFLSFTMNYCLYIFMYLGSSLLLNMSYYLLMKMTFGEFTCNWKSMQVFVYFLLVLLVGAASVLLFVQNQEDWTSSTSQVRENEGCMWFDPYPLYNEHDMWHIFTAHVFFLLFVVLLSCDDGVDIVQQEYLLVF